MDFAHFKTAAQFGRVRVNARLAQRLALYRRLAAKAMAELARERGAKIDELFLYHLPGQHDQCDHSPTGECVDDKIDEPRKDLFKAERDIVRQDVETGIIFNQKGIEASRIKGTKDKISIPAEVIIGAQIDGNATFTHNHPNGAGFSLADIQSAAFMNLKEMRAVGKNEFGKFTYILQRPEGGWPEEGKITQAYRKWRSVVGPVIADRVFKRKSISMSQGVTASGHATIKLTAKELGIPYKMIRIRQRDGNA